MDIANTNKYRFKPYGTSTVGEDMQQDTDTTISKALHSNIRSTPYEGKPTIPHHPVHSPSHYTSHPSGVECIQITEHMPFNVGNTIKYLWRAGLKDSQPAIQDLEKALWYLQREIDRQRKLQDAPLAQ